MIGLRRQVLLVGAMFAAGGAAAGCAGQTFSSGVGQTIVVHPTTPPATTRPLPGEPFSGAPGAHDRVVLRRAGRGSRELPSFVVAARSLYLEVACLGTGSVTIKSSRPLLSTRCDGSGGTSRIAGDAGQRANWTVEASASTRWAVYVTEG